MTKGNTALERRAADLERKRRWGVTTHEHAKRCPACGCKSYCHRPDGVCVECAITQGEILSCEQEEVTNGKAQLLEHDGEALTVGDWANRIGISRQALRFRIAKSGSLSQALKIPVSKDCAKAGRIRQQQRTNHSMEKQQ